VLLLAFAVPVVMCQQKNTKHEQPSKGSAPAAHASAPSRPSGPSSAGHPNMPTSSRPGGSPASGGMNRGTAGGMNHGTTGAGMNRGTAGGMNHGTTGAGMNHGTGAGMNHGAAAGMNHGTGAGMNRGTTHTGMNHATPTRQVTMRGGGTARIRPNGQVRSVSRNGMTISRGLHGGRTVVATHNGARIVTTGHNRGFVQRSYFARGGRTYVSRTYVVGGRTYVNVYRSYGYRGYCCYYGYAPAYYWHPAYYGWAYNPWPAPVYYNWGWGAAPWYGYYGAYWAPYPTYPAAYFWLTDWMVAASLQAAYQAQAEAGATLLPLSPDLELVASLGPIPVPPDDTKVVMSKEAKDALADEVKAQLAADQADAGKNGGSASSAGQAASNEPPPALDPNRRTFVVNDEVSTDVDGEECSLTSGDIISRVSDTPDDDKNVQVKVLASKKADCAIGTTVLVSLDDLQEMHNHFREQISAGMEELSNKQGTGGLPKAPDTGKQAGEVPAPAADTSAAKTLQDQQSAADQAESDAKQAASTSGGASQ